MDEISTIFPEDDKKPVDKSVKRKILIGRLFMLLHIITIVTLSIKNRNLGNTFNVVWISSLAALLTITLIRPFIGFLLATLVVGAATIYFIYLQYMLRVVYNIPQENFFTIRYLFLTTTTTIAYIIAAYAIWKTRPVTPIPADKTEALKRRSKIYITLGRILVGILLCGYVAIIISTGVENTDTGDIPYPLLYIVVLICSFIRPFWAFIIFLLAMTGTFIYDVTDIVLNEGLQSLDWSLWLTGLSIMTVIIFISLKAIIAANYLSKTDHKWHNT